MQKNPVYFFDSAELISELSVKDMEAIVNDFDKILCGSTLAKDSLLLKIVSKVQTDLAKLDSYLALQANDGIVAIQVANCCMRELLRAKL